MKKNTLLLALGGKPGKEDEDMPESEESEDSYDSEADEAIDTFLDPEADMETRREAFRRAVKACK